MANGKHLKKRKIVVNAAFRAALVLFWLVIISTYLSSGLFAKYSTGDNGSDQARTIKFDELTVTETLEGKDAPNGGTVVFTPGVNLKKDISVSFGGSEADTFVFIAVDVRGWNCSNNYDFSLSGIMSWSVVSPDWKFLSSEAIHFDAAEDESADGTRYVYYIQLEPNESLSQEVIKDGEIIVYAPDQTQKAYDALTGVGIDLNVTAYAVQANGFYDAEHTTEVAAAASAWSSLRAKEVTA